MKEKGKKLSPDPSELPSLEKRGICIYIQDAFVIAKILKHLFDLLEKGKVPSGKKLSLQKERKLSQEEVTRIMKEVASYIYFETVKQIWEYQEGDLPENDAREILDIISSYFYYSYDIDSLPKKLEEYRRAKNPFEHFSRNIVEIARDREAGMEIAVLIAGSTSYMLYDGIRRMFNLSENEMAELIEDFFVNYYPRFIKGT